MTSRNRRAPPRITRRRNPDEPIRAFILPVGGARPKRVAIPSLEVGGLPEPAPPARRPASTPEQEAAWRKRVDADEKKRAAHETPLEKLDREARARTLSSTPVAYKRETTRERRMREARELKAALKAKDRRRESTKREEEWQAGRAREALEGRLIRDVPKSDGFAQMRGDARTAEALRQRIKRVRSSAYKELQHAFEEIKKQNRLFPSNPNIEFAQAHFAAVFSPPPNNFRSQEEITSRFLGYEAYKLKGETKRTVRADPGATESATGDWGAAAVLRALALENVVQAYIVGLAAQSRLTGEAEKKSIDMMRDRMTIYASNDGTIGVGIQAAPTLYSAFLELVNHAANLAKKGQALDPFSGAGILIGGRTLFDFGIQLMSGHGAAADEQRTSMYTRKEAERMQAGNISRLKKGKRFAQSSAAKGRMGETVQAGLAAGFDTGYHSQAGYTGQFEGDVFPEEKVGDKDQQTTEVHMSPEKQSLADSIPDPDNFLNNPRMRPRWRQEARRGRR